MSRARAEQLAQGPDPRPPGYVAALLAFASAGVSAYWALGGTGLLDTVGGAIEDLARERSAAGLALAGGAALLKALAGALAVALVRTRRTPRARRPLLVVNALAAALLVLWGGANVAVGALVLTGVLDGAAPVDERALRWHVFFWDLWFVAWGLLLAVAVARARRAGRTRRPGGLRSGRSS